MSETNNFDEPEVVSNSAEVAEAPAPDAINDVIPEEVAPPPADITEIPRKGRGLSRKALQEAGLLKAHKRAIDSKVRKKRQAATYIWNSKDEPSERDAKAILIARGLKNPHVIDTCYELAIDATENLGLIPNRFLFQQGVMKSLESRAAKQACTLEEAPVTDVAGELVNSAELAAVYDFSVAWRENPVAKDYSDFIRLRRMCKTDVYGLSMLLGRDFEPSCQGEWAKFLPSFNPDLLPPRYSQKELRTWLGAATSVKNFLILGSRASMKSSFMLVWCTALHLCAPDCRLLLVSETTKLSNALISNYRTNWITRKGDETPLQILFPECCLKPGSGSDKILELPMARLNLVASAARAASHESSETGGRADVLVSDDVISNLTVGTEAQIQKSINVFWLLNKTLDVGGMTLTIGTPWHAADLYAHLIGYGQENPDALVYRIDPIVTLKEEAKAKLTPVLLNQIVESDVASYLLPIRMPWSFVKQEIRKNPAFALSQNFVVFPLPEEAEEVLNFSITALQKATINHLNQPQDGQVVIVGDIAHSTKPTADRSVIAAVRIHLDENGDKCMLVLNVVAGRFRSSQFATELVLACRKFSPNTVVLERTPTWDLLQAEIDRATAKYPTNVPLRWKTPSNVKNAKFIRLKGLEGLLSAERLKFVSAPYLDMLFEELQKLDGRGSSSKSSTRRDDQADALGLCQQLFCPALLYKDADEGAASELEQQVQKEATAKAHYNRIFGDRWVKPKEPEIEPQPAKADPRMKIFGNKGPWRL